MDTIAIIDETAAARGELRNSQYGVHANAEELMRAHFASISPEVRRGVKRRVNEEVLATARKDPDFADLIDLPTGAVLLDWTIRGKLPTHQVISYVYELPNGRAHRGVQAFDSEKYVPPVATAQEEAAASFVNSNAKLREVQAESTADVEAQVNAFRAELQADVNDTLASFKADLLDAISEKLNAAQAGSATTGDAGSDAGSDEVAWPREHAKLNKIAEDADVTPDGWGDDPYRTVDEKIAYLESKGVKPEAEG